MFSVLIELKLATKSWHETFVGMPGTKRRRFDNDFYIRFYKQTLVRGSSNIKDRKILPYRSMSDGRAGIDKLFEKMDTGGSISDETPTKS
jgi:hypothetical protein